MLYAPRPSRTDGPWALLLVLWLLAAPPLSLGAQLSPARECRNLIASQVETVGRVCVDIVDGGADVEITVSEGNGLLETRVAVAATLEGFPRSESGVPQLGLFAHSSTHQPPVSSTLYQISIEELDLDGGQLLLSVHASVMDADEVEHGAWVEGRRFAEPGPPATYFAVAVPGLLLDH